MTRLPDDNWFTEVCSEAGSAFSFALRRKLHEEHTAYQRIEIFETERFGNLMVIDGFVMLTGRDNFLYHEMMAHPVLFHHTDPKRVLIVGGGDCGTLREVLRHPGVKSAHQVEIDEAVTRLSERFFPELCEANDDPRAMLHFADAIRWVKEAEPGSYDVIIVDSTDPIGPAEGLFSEPFYRNCMAALDEGGLLIQQSESPLYHLSLLKAMHREMGRGGAKAVRTLHFPQPTYPSGWWTATMASKDQPIEGFREEAAGNRPFATRYYTPDVHRGALALPPFLTEALGAPDPA